MQKREKKLEFHFGNLGAILPFLLMLVTIVLLVITNHKSTKYYWTAGFVGLLAAYLLIKDKREFNAVIVRGIGNEMFAVLTLCFIFAGVFGKALSVGGLAQGVLWAATKLGIGVNFFPAAIFIISALLSTCMGTANGTVTTMTPVFMPTAVALGCNPVLVMGAIVGGSYFGDNLAPISDTTIVSAGTQGIDVPSCVKTRLKYSLTAGIITIIITIVLSFMTSGTPQVVEQIGVDAHKNLILILAPILLCVLIIRGMDLIPALLCGTVFAIVLSLAFGLITLEQVYSTDGGIIVGGVEGMLGIVIFSLLMFGLIQVMKESGVLEYVTSKITAKCQSPRSAELAIIAICIITTVMVPSNTVAMVLCASVVRQIILDQNMESTRGSNLLDGICVSTVGLLPYGSAIMLCQSLSVASGVVSESISTTDIIPFSIYCMALIVVYIFSALTGWGRKFKEAPKVHE